VHHQHDDEPCVVRFANPQEGSVVFDDRTTDLIVKNNRTFLRVSKTYNTRFIISMMMNRVLYVLLTRRKVLLFLT
ncbi:hypothetical protein PSY22_23475, partial [Shigella flexneri]|nr:hypothetical protein [Shigella flexneri]